MNNVDHPSHYNTHKSGVECVEVCEHLGFLLGNAVKYVWRAGLKNDKIEDLEKAAWYFRRVIDKGDAVTERCAAFYQTAEKVIAAEPESLLARVLGHIREDDEGCALARVEQALAVLY